MLPDVSTTTITSVGGNSGEGSEFVGKTIDESSLPERDINVLTLYRGTTVIPNPRLKRRLEAGDRLLCFGKLEFMRGMIPEKTRRKRRPQIQELPDEASDDSVVPAPKMVASKAPKQDVENST